MPLKSVPTVSWNDISFFDVRDLARWEADGRPRLRTPKLTATALGVAMHPMSQVLQEYSDVFDLQKRFLDYLGIPEGHTVQMLFRLGVADPVEHSPRRSVKDLQRG